VNGGAVMGCLCPELVPCDKCAHLGCSSPLFHHCCQTEWEMAQYLNDYPGGDPGQCKYESGHGSKYCMTHHPFGALAAPRMMAADEAGKDEMKKAAQLKNKAVSSGKKKQLMDFAKKQTA